MSSDASHFRDHLRCIFDAAVEAAKPSVILSGKFPLPPAGGGKIIVLAAGKAAASMMAAAEAFYLDECKLPLDRLVGLGLTRKGYIVPTRHIEVLEAGHPIPDEISLAGAKQVFKLASLATKDDLVVALISGGGSATLAWPAGDITLAEKQDITHQLLQAGAPISEINTVRKHISRIKGGRLAQAVYPAKLVTLAISDVPLDNPSTIASGPTAPDPTTHKDVLAIIGRRNIKLPASASAVLADNQTETLKSDHEIFKNQIFEIVATPADAIDAAAKEAARLGYEPMVLGSHIEGEARSIAKLHAQLAIEMKAARKNIAIISGGELTVTIKGRGQGGPNQEYLLALALGLKGEKGIYALAGDTDGTDGGSGQENDPAGAYVTPSTLKRAETAGLKPDAFLINNDSTTFFRKLDDLLMIPATNTNVNDCRVILISP